MADDKDDKRDLPLSPDQQQRYIEIWSKAVETQMHFNEMSVKSRQLGLAFVTAALGVAVVLLSRGNDFAIDIPGHAPFIRLHVSVIIVLASMGALLAVRTLDLNVYHKMLRGAVTFGEDFEEHYMKRVFSLQKGMTQAISHFSRFEDANVVNDPVTGHYTYQGAKKRTALKKIQAFYRWSLIFLGIATVALFLLSNASIWLEHDSAGPLPPPANAASSDRSSQIDSGAPNAQPATPTAPPPSASTSHNATDKKTPGL